MVRVAKWSSKGFVRNISWYISTSESTPHLKDYWSFSALAESHIVLTPLKPRDHCSKYTTMFNTKQICSLSKNYIYEFCVIFAINCYFPSLHRVSYFYSSDNIIKEIIFLGESYGREVWRTLKKGSRYGVSVGKPEENKMLGIPISRREGNIKMNFKKTGLEDMDWINLPKHKDK